MLVSDGKETCQGDPLVAAKALAAKGITVHTVGFVVDTAARRAAPGDRTGNRRHLFRRAGRAGIAGHAEIRAQRLQDARRNPAAEAAARQAAHHFGDLYSRHHQFGDRPEGRDIRPYAPSRSSLPAGIYEVKFGTGSWKGIEVRSGETTTIEPGELRVEASGAGVLVNANVINSETGEKHGTFNPMASKVTLMPGVYDLQFRKAVWRFVKVDGGKITTLKPPSVIIAEGLKWKTARDRRRGRRCTASIQCRRAGDCGRRCRRVTTSSRSTATSSRSRRPKARCSR